MKSVLNHVAILVESIEKTLEKDLFSSSEIGKIESFPSEGTRELYIGNKKTGKLLLVQAVGEGPYKKALHKRGAGLHHIALDVFNIENYLNNIVDGSGWLLHSKSIYLYNNIKQVFLARPGVPALIEVQEKQALSNDTSYIEEVKLPFAETRLIAGLACERLNIASEFKLITQNYNLGKELWS